MKINKQLRIEDLADEFSKLFPGLKMEMYSISHDEGEGSRKAAELSHDLTLGEISGKLVDAEFNFDPDMTVADVEETFRKKFGLHVQVFRRSNDLWLQTSTTDDWTLEKQNKKGLHSVQL